jgi:hypothetical protein
MPDGVTLVSGFAEPRCGELGIRLHPSSLQVTLREQHLRRVVAALRRFGESLHCYNQSAQGIIKLQPIIKVIKRDELLAESCW